ncbi:Protein Z-dependent protease inhibitor [Halotydeus destructor]|nr:Protein Z-dependent protease inhibitor [Halotydeus destructor]
MAPKFYAVAIFLLINYAQASDQVSSSINKFGLDLIKSIDSNDEKVLFSPASILAMFSMLMAGTSGNSKHELISSMNLGDVEDVHRKMNLLLKKDLKNRDGSKDEYALNIASRALVGDYPIKTQFLDTIKENYFASGAAVDFKQPEQVTSAANQWVDEQTRGKISKLFDMPLDPNTVLVLMNVIYFKATWDSPKFDSYLTKLDTFNGRKRSLQVSFMFQESKLRSSYDEFYNLDIIEVPFKGDASFIILLPRDNGTALDDFITKVNKDDLETLIIEVLSSERQRTKLWMPKFKYDTNYDLKPLMTKLGVKDVFSQTAADLSEIGGTPGQLWVDQAVHKAFIEVNEEGVEAAGAGGVTIRSRSLPPPMPLYKVDRPFLFLIRDNTANVNLFVGKVSDL